MKIVLGTESEKKRSYLDQILIENGITADITQVKVDSGVSEQPMTESETIEGAMNRAQAALKQEIDAPLGIGMEAGLQAIKGDLYLVCVVAIADRAADHVSFGVSSKCLLPAPVAQNVLSGAELWKEIRAFSKSKLNPQMKAHVAMLVDRDLPFLEATEGALTHWFLQHKNL